MFEFFGMILVLICEVGVLIGVTRRQSVVVGGSILGAAFVLALVYMSSLLSIPIVIPGYIKSFWRIGFTLVFMAWSAFVFVQLIPSLKERGRYSICCKG